MKQRGGKQSRPDTPDGADPGVQIVYLEKETNIFKQIPLINIFINKSRAGPAEMGGGEYPRYGRHAPRHR